MGNTFRWATEISLRMWFQYLDANNLFVSTAWLIRLKKYYTNGDLQSSCKAIRRHVTKELRSIISADWSTLRRRNRSSDAS